MSRVAYVNGQYVPLQEAGVHVEDRGYQFADGVYEVIAFAAGRMLEAEGHLERLDRSLAELAIAAPMGRRALRAVLAECIRRNRLSAGIVYVQITRGVARRDHAFPAHAVPTLVVTVRRATGPPKAAIAEGVGVITLPDIRWKRCDIKSVALLPNVLAKQAARQRGAFEAWMVGDDGAVTEGSSTNAWIVTKEGEVVTHPAGPAILNGITRMAVIAAARRAGFSVVERSFTVAEALAAREAFLTSTTSHVLPVVSIDGKPVGNGHPGSTTIALRQAYLADLAISGGAGA
jgi:D-alanine transaminase